jgi:ABC-type oligopeptide transport system substrate-binding subunit
MARASTLEELRNATRALDRVVMWHHWGVPFRYSADSRMSYWNRFGLPANRPRFYTIESVSASLPAWPLMAWWALPDNPRQGL